MSKLPWFPFWGRDFFGDEKVKLFTLRQVGLYLSLLWHEWEHGSVPSLEECKNFSSVKSEYLDSMRRDIDHAPQSIAVFDREVEEVFSTCFVYVEGSDNRFINQKLECVRAEQNIIEKMKEDRSRKGGLAKALLKQCLGPANSLLKPANQRQRQNLSSSSPNPRKDSTKKKKVIHDISSWLEELKCNPAYGHIEFQEELGKIDAWLSLPKNAHRKKTQAFILGWFNRIERPILPVKSIETCLFQEQKALKNGRLPIYGPCGKPIALGSKKRLCEGHTKAEQERTAPKPVLELLQGENTV